jgi:kinesin family protein 4/21/27
MVACLAPIDLYADENISTLQYAARASVIANVPKINVDPKVRTILD